MDSFDEKVGILVKHRACSKNAFLFFLGMSFRNLRSKKYFWCNLVSTMVSYFYFLVKYLLHNVQEMLLDVLFFGILVKNLFS